MGGAVGIDPTLLRDQCERTLASTDFTGLGRRIEGKVRDSYVAGKRRFIVVTDRVSCFDRVVGTLPFKGQVLNQIAAFWFERTRAIAPNHLLEVPDPNVSIVRECRPLPVEFVYRGYLTGSTSTSIWTAYARGERVYCGHRLPDGLRRHEPLPQPILTPTTKAPHGEHDELTSRGGADRARHALRGRCFDECARITAALFAEGSRFAAEPRPDPGRHQVRARPRRRRRRVVVIDEIHTPDSSRYWYRDAYQRALQAGRDPEALDKEYVRRWLAERGYRGEGPPPELPVDVRCEAARRYIEAFEQLTGRGFEPDPEPPLARIRRRLGV